jgi:hypothetical protein
MLAFAVVCWPGCLRELCRGGRLALSVWRRVVTIVPDTKDWAWVLERPCPECGLNAPVFARDAIAGMISRNARQWQDVLAGPGDTAHRLSPGIWSALEYACHVRDILRLYDERLVLMLTTGGPRYPNWDQDATAVAGRYAEQDPARVAADLGDAAGVIAARFGQVSGDRWQRAGFRSDGARFTVESFARYFVHDLVHHLYDVTGVPGTCCLRPRRLTPPRPMSSSARGLQARASQAQCAHHEA